MGQELIVHTDHLNLLYKKLASARLVRWRMLLEEYGPTFEHIQGTKNVVADALSRLDMQTKVQDTQKDTEPSTQLSYLTEEDIIEESFPMSPKEIHQHQLKDKTLENKITQDKEYNYKKIEGKNLIHYRDRIYVPETL